MLLKRILTRISPGCVGKESGHEGKSADTAGSRRTSSI